MNKHLLLMLTTAFLLAGNARKAKAQTFPVKPFVAISKGQSQKGQGLEKSYDSNTNTLYHSVWNRNGIPDTLDYYFYHAPKIDSLKYTPRQDGSSNGRWGEVEIWAATQYPLQFVHLTTVNWQQSKTIKSLKLPGTGIDHPLAIRFVVKSAYGNFSSVAEMDFYGPKPQTASTAEKFDIDKAEVTHLGDVKIPISHGKASNFQPGSNIENSFDGDYHTLYHSNHRNKTFPISLEYSLTEADKIDFILYHPRGKENKNGAFGRIKVEARTEDGTYQTLIEAFDCKESSTPSLIMLPSSFYNPAQVKITVLSGYNNFASAAEIGFYKNRELKNDYQSIFTDHLYSELRRGITQKSIDTISDLFFKKLAQDLLHNNYNKKFRFQSFSAIPSTAKTREKLKLAFEYSHYQNPTGIAFENNSTVVVFVDQYNTEFGLISLKVRDFADETSRIESVYPLKPGINKLTLSNSGLGYIDYYSEVSDLPEVKINIAGGSVNGYLSYDDSVEDWQEKLNNTIYPKIDLAGNYVGINILKRPLLQHAIFNGKEVLQKWDSIVKIQFHQMGLVKYDLVPKNKMFAWVESKGGYYATNNISHFDLSWGEEALTSVNSMDWGIYHEFGHQNQIRNGLTWTGTSEVTNNIYAVYTNYLFKPSKLTRLETVNDSYQDVRLTGNLFNIYYNETGRKQQNIMSRPNVFERLIPFWQLQLFYAIAGAGIQAPTLEQVMANKNTTGNTDYANWFGITAQTVRNQTTTNIPNGQQMMNFTKYVSDAVQQDLTDFFTEAGFFTPFDAIVSDYTSARITVTEADIESAKAYITSKGYPKPQSPVIHYITAHNMHMYQNNLAPEGIPNSGFTVENTIVPGKTYYKIAHDIWKNAVAFETIDAENTVLFITAYATGDLSGQTTTVFFPENAVNIYAVGADGTRLPVLRSVDVPDNSNNETIIIAPNPATDTLTITVGNPQIIKGILVDFYGQVSKQFPIDRQTSVNVSDLTPGFYFLILETIDGSQMVKKIAVNHS